MTEYFAVLIIFITLIKLRKLDPIADGHYEKGLRQQP